MRLGRALAPLVTRAGPLVGTVIGATVLAAALVAVRASPSSEAGGRIAPPPSVPSGIEGAVGRLFSADACVNGGTALATLTGELARLGFADWTVTFAPGGEQSACVRAAIDAAAHVIRLLPALTPMAREAMRSVYADLMQECLDEAAATSLVLESLREAGVPMPVIRTDGPIGGPVDEYAKVIEHIDEGCFVYTGSGWTDIGEPVFYLAGRR